jgi:hypothetical protein
MTLFGHPQPDDLANALATVGEILAPFVGREPPATKLAARLPLGAAGSGAVSFWWDTARRLGRWQRNVPILFWEGGVPEPQVLMHFGDVAPRALAELWFPNPDSPFSSDLSAARDRPGVQLESTQGFLSRLQSPAMLVSDFLSAL